MQDALFFDNANAALRHTVEACGGFKKVGPMMRPDKSPDMAAQWLRDSLNDNRPERLSPDQVNALIRIGHSTGCHAYMRYLSHDCGYSTPEPVNADDERAELQREFNDSVKRLEAMAARMARPSFARVA